MRRPALFLCEQRLGGGVKRKAMSLSDLVCRALGMMPFGGRSIPGSAAPGMGVRRSGITGILLPPRGHPAPPACRPQGPRGTQLFPKNCSSHGRALGRTLSFVLRLTSLAQLVRCAFGSRGGCSPQVEALRFCPVSEDALLWFPMALHASPSVTHYRCAQDRSRCFAKQRRSIQFPSITLTVHDSLKCLIFTLF